ncbi:hypothetical protein U0070_011346, partial [Myodes glareolus]
ASRDLSSWATTMTHWPLPISLSFSRARPLHLHGGCLGICPVISDVKQAEVPIGGRSSARANPRAGPREISVEGTRRREIAGRGGCGACCLLLATPGSAKPRGVTGPGAWSSPDLLQSLLEPRSRSERDPDDGLPGGLEPCMTKGRLVQL